MKTKFFVLGIVSGILFLNSCDDMGLVGPSMQPVEDTPNIFADTFMLKASTVTLDSVYAKTERGLLGEIYDPVFGNLKTDFICQFYIQEGFKFRQTPIDGKIDSIDLRVYYQSRNWIGDSLAAMKATIYPVIKQLDRNYYTNINPADYVDLNNPISSKIYTARDQTVSDSIWNNFGTTWYTYNANIKFDLPVSLGQQFYDESVNNPASFANQNAFNDYFPGLYITTTFGSGNILSVDETEMTIYYRYYEIRPSTGVRDSIAHAIELFPVTKEVIQMNRSQHANLDKLLEPNDKYTYIKTPAGVCTRITFPTKEIIERIKGRRINTFHFQLKVMKEEQWKYALTPTSLLLIHEDSVKTFFENRKVDDLITSYAAEYKSSTLTYDFTSGNINGNLANLIKFQIENAPDKDLNMLVIPIDRTTYQNSSSSYQPTTTTELISSYLRPSGVTLRKDPEVMQIQVITSAYNK
ncbi:MAG: DUF4270 domain-containing protein [Tannerellaceae bacterium]|jgi:hypothetical protein|nr:DUF4270 domain-containing protein [Tannerellaceae bacterium]